MSGLNGTAMPTPRSLSQRYLESLVDTKAAILRCEGFCKEPLTPHDFARVDAVRDPAGYIRYYSVVFACRTCDHERKWGFIRDTDTEES